MILGVGFEVSNDLYHSQTVLSVSCLWVRCKLSDADPEPHMSA